MRFRAIGAALCALVLCGCHADITERIAANRDNTVTVSYREVVDAQLVAALAKIGGSDPFREAAARNAGWTVAESQSPNGELVVSYSRTTPAHDMRWLSLRETNAGTVDGFDCSPASVFTFGVAMTRQLAGGDTVPALLFPDQVLSRPGHDPDAAAAAANAARNADAVDSLVSVHLELKTVGPVTATNGVLLPDHSVRWDLHFSKPADVALTSGPFVTHILAAVPHVTAGKPDSNDPSTPPAPPQADWSAVYASGVYYGPSPIFAWQNVGQGGTYDFMRWGKAAAGANAQYRPAAEFATGVYSNGAGIPQGILDAAMQLLPDLRT